jgi:ubiquinone/menaquinone biosynthesis C-methylase UbiE
METSLALRRMDWKSKRKTRRGYDAQADSYDELYADEQRRKYELALNQIDLGAEDRILDCGCGTGLFLENVAGNVHYAVGVDFSFKMLHGAKFRLGQKWNVDLVCADFDHLPFLGGRFSHIFMFTALPSTKYSGNAISEALRVLKPSGAVALSVPKKETSSEKLLTRLSMNGLKALELVDHETSLDYVVIGKWARKS